MLFDRFSVLELLPEQERRLKAQIESLPPNDILNISEEDLIASLTRAYTLDVPVLDQAGIHVDYGEQKIDVSRDPMRLIHDRSRPFHLAGTRVTFIIPFAGDADLLRVRPQSYTRSVSGSSPEVVGNEIHVTYAGLNLDPERAKGQFDNELSLLNQNLANLKTAIDGHNARLGSLIRAHVQQRKNKLLADANLAAAIGYPIKRRDGVPATYAIPVQKRKPQIERPAAPSGPFQPEPVLAMAEYEEILSIIQNMVRVMEQSPKAFEKMGEEDLRTHFLVQLNGQYEGRATGQTFNFQGKTDILIREGGRNVFVAECKFWSGEKQLLETINQALSYLSWRDTKLAVLIFSRNVNFSEVLAKIAETAPTHKNFKRAVGKLGETGFRYVFHLPDDPNREVTLTVLAFHIPTIRSGRNSEE
jgi:hypothetical protein